MKTILITGATDGIGLETAKMLAQEGHNLLLHGRNKNKLEETKNHLLGINRNLKIELYLADFSNLKEVHAMADALLQKKIKLDVLINNAGVFTVPSNQKITQDNLDIRFEVNTIAPYILTKKLLPSMNQEGRIINLGSAAQAPVDFQAFLNNKRLMPLSDDEAYAQSKLALTMWTIEMAQSSQKTGNSTVFITVNPKSFLGSKMVKEAYGREGYDLKIGADILTRAALSDEFKSANGKYFDNDFGMFTSPHPFALDKNNRLTLIKILDEFA